MTSTSFSVDHAPAANDAPRLQVGKIQPGWYMCEKLPDQYRRMKNGWDEWRKVRPHFRRNREWVTALAYIPCPLDPGGGGFIERTICSRDCVIEIDGREIEPEHIWSAWVLIANWPITREDFLRRRGIHAGW